MIGKFTKTQLLSFRYLLSLLSSSILLYHICCFQTNSFKEKQFIILVYRESINQVKNKVN